MLHSNITKKISGAFFKVNNTSGFGFLEKVYENAMAIELCKMGCKVEQQKNNKVFYEKEVVGNYFADLVLVELKASEDLRKEHEAQLINYLKATEIEVGLLLSFGKKAEFRRKIFTNDRK